MKFILTVLFVVLTACILSNAPLSMSYAALGLKLWFEKMIPALLPFMILSGIMIRLGLTEKVSMVLYPVLAPVFRVRKNVVYCMVLGFLCGFPMGAKVTADMLSKGKISEKEGEFLLAFCNNIGPVYFCSFVLPLLGRRLTVPYLFGMYGIPLLYGLFLRYTAYKDLVSEGKLSSAQLCCCEKASNTPKLLEAVDESVVTSLQSILNLGGYMILFNLLNLPIHILIGREPRVTAPLLEITGGLSMLGGRLPLFSLLALSFGGLSCLAQTYSCIRKTDLSAESYGIHKVILTVLNAVYYLCWFLFLPETFLR